MIESLYKLLGVFVILFFFLVLVFFLFVSSVYIWLNLNHRPIFRPDWSSCVYLFPLPHQNNNNNNQRMNKIYSHRVCQTFLLMFSKWKLFLVSSCKPLPLYFDFFFSSFHLEHKLTFRFAFIVCCSIISRVYFFFSQSSQNVSFFICGICASFTVWQPFTRWIPMCTFRYFHDRIYGSSVQLKCNHKQIPKAKIQSSQLKRKKTGRVLVDAPQRYLYRNVKRLHIWREQKMFEFTIQFDCFSGNSNILYNIFVYCSWLKCKMLK